MADVVAIGIKSFDGSDVSPDGLHGLFKFHLEDSEMVIAIPHAILMPFMAAISHVSGQSARIRGQDKSIKHVFPCDWWEFSLDHNGQHSILSFQMPGGLEMSFQVARDRITMMRETLETMEGASPTGQSSGSAQH
jgi:hypothetical protein